MSSILSTPEARPDAIYALLRFVEAEDREMSLEEVTEWMAPTLAEVSTDRRLKLTEHVKSLRDAAGYLGLLVAGTFRPTQIGLTDWTVFTDRLHLALVERGEQRELLDAYASMLVEVELVGSEWLSGTVNSVANRLRDRLQVADERGETGVMSTTRWPAWRDWMVAAGLGWPGADGIAHFLPLPSERLGRIARGIPELRKGDAMSADDFLQSVARQMPYVDRGSRSLAAWRRASNHPGSSVSRVLTAALRDLDERHVLVLEYEGGDRAGARRLADDGHDPKAFASVKLGEEGR